MNVQGYRERKGVRRETREEKGTGRLEWHSTTESRDYSRINSLLVYVGTGVGFYELVWAVVSTIEGKKTALKRFLRNFEYSSVLIIC